MKTWRVGAGKLDFLNRNLAKGDTLQVRRKESICRLGALILLGALLACVWSGYQELTPWAAQVPQGLPRALCSTPELPTVLILVPGLGLDGLWGHGDGDPNSLLEHLSGEAAAALVNVRTAGRDEWADTLLTLGAGTRARVNSLPEMVLPCETVWMDDLPAGDVLQAWYGRGSIPEGLWVADAHAVAQEQAGLPHRVPVGCLGSAVHRAGGKTALIDAAPFKGMGRLAALALMDADGWVDYHATARRSKYSDPEPLQRQKNGHANVLRLVNQLPGDTALVAVVLDDFAWLDFLQPRAPVQWWSRSGDAAVGNLAQLVRSLKGSEHPVIILDPLAGGPGMAGLSGVLVAGGEGLLTSATTRRPGLVTLGDITSSVMAQAGSGDSGGAGRPLTKAALPRDLTVGSFLSQLARRVEAANQVRPYLARTLVAAAILAFIGALAALTCLPAVRRWVSAVLLGLFLLPLAFCLAPYLCRGQTWGAVLSAGCMAWAILLLKAALLSRAGVGSDGLLRFTAAGYLFFIAFDQAAGGLSALFSPLGYSALAGARFYGMGNEFLGIMLGALPVLLYLGDSCAAGETLSHPGGRLGAGGTRSFPARVAILALAGMVCLSPDLGTNIGGGLTLLLASPFLLLSGDDTGGRKDRGPRWLGSRGLRWMGLSACTIALALLLLSRHWSGAPETYTHLGWMTVGDGTTSLGRRLGEMVARKAATGLRLIRYTIWTRAWMVSLAALAYAGFGRPNGMSRWARLRPGARALITGPALLGTLALLLNDSGVVTAALASMLPVCGMFIVLLNDSPARRTARPGGEEGAAQN